MKLTNTLIILLFIACFYSCYQPAQTSDGSMTGTVNQLEDVISMLASFNTSASNAGYETYLNFFTHYAVFNGTDATARWKKKNFWFDKTHF